MPNDSDDAVNQKFANYAIQKNPGFKGDTGDAGPADNTYTSYAAMQASDPTRRSARLVGDTDSAPHPDGPYSNPSATIGGWIPQPGDGVNFDGRSVSAKLSDFVSVKDARFAGGAKGDGVTDDTAAIQAAINAVRDGGTLLFPSGFYKVTTLDSGRSEVTWAFDNAKLLAGATVPTDCLIRFRGLHCRIEGMQINGNFNLNYTCMLWWYNASEASQHNSFVNLEIRYTKRGIVYGEMPGQTSTFYAQSENSIVGYRTRGVEKPLYNNHANGFLFLIAPQLVAHDEEWPDGGGFDRAANRCFEIAAGNLIINGGEIQNTIDPLGYAAEVIGGTVYVADVITEVSVPFLVSAGVLNISGGRVLNTQSITPQFKVPTTASATARIKATDVHFERVTGTGGFSGQPFIDNAGAPAIEVTIAGCEIDDWTRSAPLVVDHAESVRIEGSRWMPDGSVPTDFYRLNTGGQDLLDRMSIDRTGNTTEGFYPVLFYGGTTSGQNADVPSAAFATSMFVNTAGEAGFFTADGTSLATLKQTAFRCRPGDRFLIEGWIKKQTGDNAGLALIQFDGSGAMLPAAYLMVADTTGGFVTGAWRYVRQVVTIPADSSAAFVGPGMAVKVGEGRFCGLQMRRADWNRR